MCYKEKILKRKLKSVASLKRLGLQRTNLKDGIGDPWAGHGRLKVFAKLAEKPEIVFAEGNLGAEPPTGSEKETKLEERNLKAGTGDPCAGRGRRYGIFSKNEYFY